MVKADGAMTSTTDVWSAYEIWCAKQGVTAKEKLGRNTLLGKIEDRLGVTLTRESLNGQRTIAFEGWGRHVGQVADRLGVIDDDLARKRATLATHYA